MLLSYKPLHLEAQQRLQEEGCVVDITYHHGSVFFCSDINAYKTSETDNIIAWSNKKIIDALETYQASPSLIRARPRVGK